MSRPPSEPSAAASRPIVVDAQALANSGAIWEAEFTSRRFPRLADIALSDVPSLSVRLQFSQLEGRPLVRGEISGTVQLKCQRCLRPMAHPVQEEVDVLLVSTEAELDALPESQDAVVTDTHRFEVSALVEEQLLLSLPLIAMHDEEDECLVQDDIVQTVRLVRPSDDDAPAPEETQRPFANLRDLLNK